ncbi:hypothetical protein CDD80_2250 [Ophiocordyceps camponoti-rufipedis]|uniref:Uncharacterized protein n=1 Tax=Ophiocordyceps camponoti-rufipedis TaxID=2004952 RepID=A0A2C5XKL5_9HYPO|nr:hypothetical protein CDD80_2250 [Ophiocordyceps camponoti-rufipedis]
MTGPPTNPLTIARRLTRFTVSEAHELALYVFEWHSSDHETTLQTARMPLQPTRPRSHPSYGKPLPGHPRLQSPDHGRHSAPTSKASRR